MARYEKDTESSQFFITQSIQPHLDGGYTAFGTVVEGMDVVDRIVEGTRIVRARVEPGAPAPSVPNQKFALLRGPLHPLRRRHSSSP